MEPFVKKQYDEYQANRTEKTILSKDELRDRIIKDLSQVSKMGVGEYTLYQKYLEIHMKYPTQDIGTLFGEEKQLVNESHLKLINETKNNIWFPKDPMDFEKLEPELVYTDSLKDKRSAGTLTEKWNCIRTFTSTMKNSSNIGRNMHYIVRDKVSGKYLGVICITGDFIDLTPRDNYIGWEREYKTNSGKLNHSCIGSTIVPLQPLGFNYTGGKLLALLCLSDDIQKQWEDELTKETEKEMLNYAEEHFNEKYFLLYVAKRENGQTLKRDHRNRMRQMMYSKLDIPKDIQKSDHQRGIYYSPLYDNTCEFLRGEIEEDSLVKSFDTSTEALTELWKEKYARKRITNLINNDRINLDETLFYDDVCFQTWDETKAKYLGEVGR